MPSQNPFTEPLHCDTSRRYVRILEEHANGCIAFEFAVGWPELAVELLLPKAAFISFCQLNQVQQLPTPAASTHSLAGEFDEY